MEPFWKESLESMDASERLDRNLAILSDHAVAVAESSPFYRQRLAEAGVDPAHLRSLDALRSVPPLSKTEIIADQATDPPYGTMLGAPAADVVRHYIGPGPQTTYFTAGDYNATVDNAAWAFWTMGFRREDVVDNTIMYHWVIAGTTIDEAYRRIGCAVIPGGIGNPQMHLDVMKWSKVTGLFAFPTFLDEIGNKATELGIDPARDLDLRVGCISGELRSADAKERMEDFWGMKVRELYGGAEVPFTAAESDCGGGMHLNPDFIFEVVHPETREPVEPGEPGVIVVTDLQKQAYPMLRYFTSDITEFYDPSPCECGRTTGKIGRILGRHGDIPRVKGLFLVPAQVREALLGAGIDAAFQLVVERPGSQDVLTIRVEGDVDAAAAARAVKDTTRLTPEIESVPVGTLADAPVLDDRRSV